MVTRTNRRSRPAARRGKVARGLATPLFLLGMLLLSAYSAFAQDDAGATEVMDTASLIVGDIRAPVYVDEDGNFVEADTNKYSETYMPSCSQVCAKLPGGATSGSAADCKLRKQLYNQLIELRGNIRVFCRVRPLFGKEISEEEEDVTRFPEEDEITVLASDGSYSRAKTYEFDKVFEPDVGQTGVFEEVAPLIASVLDGYNFWIFAYGQTGRGKTYTMEGPREDPGVNARAISELFRLAEERGEDYEINVSASVLEIYNEQLRDLLTKDKNAKLEAKLAKDGSVHVPGLTAMRVETPQDIVKVMEVASKNRSVHATEMNEHSSRSHAMLSVSVTCRNRISKQEHRGKLHLVDLAGSERVGKSEATGARLKEAQSINKEAQSINKSLSSLGDVIQALSAKREHVPFRNSKLTYVLQDSLGGHSKILMFVQVSPAGSNTSETRCSLDFAARARNVELGQARANTIRYGDTSGGDNGHAKQSKGRR